MPFFARNHESFLTSSKHPSTLRAKKGNQISPLADNYSKFGYSCENTIGDGLRAGLMNGIITVSEAAGKKIQNNIQIPQSTSFEIIFVLRHN